MLLSLAKILLFVALVTAVTLGVAWLMEQGGGATDAGGGVGAFLRRQLSIRSTAPREGTDPDAVLARAEAALGQGRLGVALREVEGLPEPARAAMAGWIAEAEARAGAEAALAGLRAGPAVASPEAPAD